MLPRREPGLPGNDRRYQLHGRGRRYPVLLSVPCVILPAADHLPAGGEGTAPDQAVISSSAVLSVAQAARLSRVPRDSLPVGRGGQCVLSTIPLTMARASSSIRFSAPKHLAMLET
jgi:hypothetical protein